MKIFSFLVLFMLLNTSIFAQVSETSFIIIIDNIEGLTSTNPLEASNTFVVSDDLEGFRTNTLQEPNMTTIAAYQRAALEKEERLRYEAGRLTEQSPLKF